MGRGSGPNPIRNLGRPTGISARFPVRIADQGGRKSRPAKRLGVRPAAGLRAHLWAERCNGEGGWSDRAATRIGPDAGQTGAGGTGEPADEFQPDPRNVRLLKWAIYIMSALLVIGTIVVAVTIAKRASSLGKAGRAGFEALDVAIAAGARVEHVDVDGDRMAVHVRHGDGGAGEIIIINIRRGRLDGRVRLREAE